MRHNYTSYNNNGDNNMLMYPNTNIPVRFFGSDFILVPPQSRRPTTACSRFINYQRTNRRKNFLFEMIIRAYILDRVGSKTHRL